MMSDKLLTTYATDRMDAFLSHYKASSEKYRAIWDYYSATMPECIASCSDMKARYTSESWLDGPQGIYWIGKDPRLFFIGREHFGWFGESKWPEEMPSVCFAPLEFAYFTVPSMGGYWGVVKDIMERALNVDLGDWDKASANVAFSNACKCLTGNGTFQWNLHQQCLNRGYVEKEIFVVKAPVTIMFTRAYELYSKIFAGKLEIIKKDAEFIVSRVGSQKVIECAHPGRQSKEWRDRLIELVKNLLKEAEQGSQLGRS
ncbi:hypothetical protein ACUUL3_04910 [Thiovibrio sp. JS02]